VVSSASPNPVFARHGKSLTSLVASFEYVAWAALLAAVQSRCSVEDAHILLRETAAAETAVDQLAAEVAGAGSASTVCRAIRSDLGFYVGLAGFEPATS
jgi:hypothetical protein